MRTTRNMGGFLVLAAFIVCLADYAPSARADEARQEVAQARADQNGEREQVLVSFTTSAPDGVEIEVAKAHKLELMSKLPLPTLGLRIVRYAIPDSRTADAVLASLRADTRVSSAQANIQYQQVEPDGKETVVGSIPEASPPILAKRALRKPAERRTASIFGEGRPSRTPRMSASDVLAGGL